MAVSSTAALFGSLSSGPGAGTTVWSATLTTDQGAVGGYGIRNLASSLSGGGSFIRIRFEAPASGTFNVDNASVGIRSATSTTTATPSELLFSGVSGFSISNGATLVSDWLAFTFTSSDSLLVHMDFGATATTRYTSTTSETQYFKAANGADYLNASVSGYSSQTQVMGFNRIEAG